MVRICFICKKPKEERLHALPKEAELCRKWMDACGVEETHKRAVYICSKHFRKEDYSDKGTFRYLRKDAFPTLHLQTVKCTQCLKKEPDSNISSDNPQPVNQKSSHSLKDANNVLLKPSKKLDNATVTTEYKRHFKDPRYATEICLEDFSTPRQAKRAIKLFQNTLQNKNKLIKKLQDNIRYLRKKVKSMEKLITESELREKNVINPSGEK